MKKRLVATLALAVALLCLTGPVFAQNNTTTLTQDGGDDARLKQVNGSSATITQAAGQNVVYGIGDATFNQQGSQLTVTQDVAFGESGNVVRGEQLGNNNNATITQHNASFAEVLQNGVSNELDLQQYLGEPQEFYLAQLGNNNRVDFLQTRGDAGSYAEILQRGNRNVVDGLDEAGALAPSEGADDRALQVRGDQTLMLDQLGNANELYVQQSGGIESSGDNTLRLSQRDGAYGEVLQIGDANLVESLNGGKAVSLDSRAIIKQDGTSNTLRFNQFSSGNTLTATQTGASNYAEITQN